MNRGIWLGFIFFVALVILGFGTLLVKNVRLFGKTVQLRVHFERAQGLRPGSDVRVDGIQFGRVDAVDLHPQSGVRVLVKLNDDVKLYAPTWNEMLGAYLGANRLQAELSEEEFEKLRSEVLDDEEWARICGR